MNSRYKHTIGTDGEVSPVVPPATDPTHAVNLQQVEEIAADVRVDASVATSYALDWDKEVYNLTMTADTTFSDSNLPTGTSAKVLTLYLTGNFIPTFPAYWTVDSSSDAYDGTIRNRIVIDCINGNSASEDVTYEINNL